jgi:hypothetical protein
MRANRNRSLANTPPKKGSDGNRCPRPGGCRRQNCDPIAAVGAPLSSGRSSTPHGRTLAKRLRASAFPPWLVFFTSWPRSRVTYPLPLPKKTGRSCLARSTAEPIAEDPVGRQPTFGIVARAPRRQAESSPAGCARGTTRVRFFLFDGALWSSLAPRSRPPTERARQHNSASAAANESQPSVPDTPRL